MEHESTVYTSPTVDLEEVFEDFKGRRAAMIKALTTEFEEFYQQCSPEMENLCLYGHPDERWEVNLPSEEVPSELPEPALGINFARDGLRKADWLSLVAIHSDVWLLSMAFYFGARFGFDKSQRNSLFGMINDLPTIFEVVIAPPKKQKEEEKPSTSNHSSSKPKSSATSCLMKLKQLCIGVLGSRKPKSSESNAQEGEEDGLEMEEDEEHKETLCGDCEEEIASDEFGICCDVCEKWFHGKCAKITNERGDFIKQHKCPSCSNKRARSE